MGLPAGATLVARGRGAQSRALLGGGHYGPIGPLWGRYLVTGAAQETNLVKSVTAVCALTVLVCTTNVQSKHKQWSSPIPLVPQRVLIVCYHLEGALVLKILHL